MGNSVAVDGPKTYRNHDREKSALSLDAVLPN